MNTPTRPITEQEQSSPIETASLKSPRVPVIDPPPGCFRLTMRRSDAVHVFSSGDEMNAWLDSEYGVTGWFDGTNAAGFADSTIRDDEGWAFADVEEF